MSTGQWHLAPTDLAAYGDGSLGGVGADSAEAHLLRCPECRAQLAARVDTAERDRRWEQIAVAIDRPTRSARLATWLRLAVGTPELLWSALALLVALLAIPLLLAISNPRAGIAWFLAAAPVMPVLGAVFAYRTAADPAGEIATATPLHSFRIVVLRASVALAVAVPIGVVTSALLPVPTLQTVGWLLPGVAFCAVVLAAGTSVDPARVGAVLAIGWAAFVAVVFFPDRRLPVSEIMDDLVINRLVVQTTFAAVTLLAAGVFLVRRDAVAYARA